VSDRRALAFRLAGRQKYASLNTRLPLLWLTLLCFLIFLDNLLKQIEGPRDTVWFGFSSGRWGLILVFGVLSVLCQLLFWSDVVRMADRGTRGE